MLNFRFDMYSGRLLQDLYDQVGEDIQSVSDDKDEDNKQIEAL